MRQLTRFWTRAWFTIKDGLHILIPTQSHYEIQLLKDDKKGDQKKKQQEKYHLWIWGKKLILDFHLKIQWNRRCWASKWTTAPAETAANEYLITSTGIQHNDDL